MNILDQIVAQKMQEIAELKMTATPEQCKQDFKTLFKEKPFLIAEIKAASPSEGIIAENFDPIAVAKDYIAGGANALSILTDQKFFGGSYEILQRVRQMTSIPLLCKEFIIDKMQIDYARVNGADLCLLIVKILKLEKLKELKTHIENLGMKAVIEVQTQEELDIALATNPEIILINNRNLSDFKINRDTVQNLINNIPDAIKVIAASGIQTPEELKIFPNRIDGFLIGTALMRAKDKIAFLKQCRQQNHS